MAIRRIEKKKKTIFDSGKDFLKVSSSSGARKLKKGGN